jgi:hypothetical protein
VLVRSFAIMFCGDVEELNFSWPLESFSVACRIGGAGMLDVMPELRGQSQELKRIARPADAKKGYGCFKPFFLICFSIMRRLKPGTLGKAKVAKA